MSIGSPSAYLLWAILSCIFLVFLILHLWRYDKFNCLKWDSGRQPGAFKRVMTYSYLATLPLLVLFSVTITAIKYKEGYVAGDDGRIGPRPVMMWHPKHKRWLLPLYFILSISWSLELYGQSTNLFENRANDRIAWDSVTHLEELTFWLFLLHQGPGKRDWFHSWEFRIWYLGSMIAILGMPLITLVTRTQIETSLAWTFLAGSSAGTSTTVCFLYVLFRFPTFLEYVKVEGADPDVVVRLTAFYQLNCIRVIFRFIFTIPLLIIALDGLKDPYPIIGDPFALDFLLMMGGMGCFISSAITLLIFFPRSVTNESGYKAKIRSPQNSAKQPTVTSPLPDYYSQHEQAPSSPKTGFEHGSPTPTVRMGAFRFPQDSEALDPVHALDPHSRPPRRRDSGVSRDMSPGYDSDDESIAMTSPTMPSMLVQSTSQPGHRRLSNPPGTRSDDTMWEGFEEISSSAVRRHSDGPFAYNRRSVPGMPVSQEQLRERPAQVSQLHPYVINFTSPIDLMDGRDEDRILTA